MEEEYKNLIKEEEKRKIDNFIDFHKNKGSKLVLVTSGGTTVPLEEKTVRFIDNFSAGTRGSASAEYFIANSYAVLFIHRKRSLKPYERVLSDVSPLEYLIPSEEKSGEYRVDLDKKPKFGKVLEAYRNALKENMLLEISFITLFDYFSVLDYSCKAISRLDSKCMVYLAAAVSDFYLPKSCMSVHKIQSNAHQSLKLDLQQVPKLLGVLRSEWCPQAFVVSFKLETDPSILMSKIEQALSKYKHNCVVGNLLEDRKNNVVVVESAGRVKNIHAQDVEIEQLLVEYLANLHSIFLESK